MVLIFQSNRSLILEVKRKKCKEKKSWKRKKIMEKKKAEKKHEKRMAVSKIEKLKSKDV